MGAKVRTGQIFSCESVFFSLQLNGFRGSGRERGGGEAGEEEGEEWEGREE